jgi:transcriptional regulator with GAF, ATPase, and Fis domain
MDCQVNSADSTAGLTRWNADLAFHAVVEATADKAGMDFMRELVRNLAQSLGVDYAFVAEFAGSAGRVRTIALWSKDDWAANVEYPLPGTPCEQVLGGGFCFYQDHVQQLFPKDTDLVTLGVRSYLGVPLRGVDGRTLGHLAAMDSRAMAESPRDLTLFEVFANRARVEMERLHAEAVLRRACDELQVRLDSAQRHLDVARQHLNLAYGELQVLLEINQLSTRHLRRADLFAELARSVKPLLPTQRFGIEEKTGPESLRVHVLALDQPASGPMIEDFPSAGTACRWAQENRSRYVAHTREELRERFPKTYEVMARESMESLCALPLVREDRSFGALFFMSMQADAYQKIPVELLDRVAFAVAGAVDNCFAYEQVSALRDQLAAQNTYLQEEIRSEHNFEEIVGQSPPIQAVLGNVRRVATTAASVLIRGETGTGKELIARAIHSASARREQPLIKVNCAALPTGLVESELFGHEKGAFTGAINKRVGRFELADGGTIFLDEIGEVPLDIQVKLLRVLQEREFERVGGKGSIKVDVRIIAATNRDLLQAVGDKTFREDLFYRLNVFPLLIPPLRDRRDDIPLLVSFLIDKFATKIGKRIQGVSERSMRRLQTYHWPGNVRELENVIERAIILADDPVVEIDPETLPRSEVIASDAVKNEAGVSLVAVERQHILKVLEQTGGVIEGPHGAAKVLDMNSSTLRYRLKVLGIKRDRHAST